MADVRRTFDHPDLTGYAFGLPDDDEQEQTRRHLRSCPACAQELEELGGLVGALRTAAPIIDVPSNLERRVFAAMGAEDRRASWRAENEWSPKRRVLKVWAAHQTLAIRLRDALGRIKADRSRLPALAAALMTALVLVAVGVQVAKPSQPSSPFGATPADGQTIHLVAVDGERASGTAKVERSSGGEVVQLEVQGLPENPPGELYVCWLVDEGDSIDHPNRVAVGTFNVSGSGPVTVRWSTGANTEQYRLDVTLEKADGNPLRRGPEVLTAAQ